ncbi:patatin-like phospholipase family protein [Anoxybacterium hadale]|uniref:Patatin-like phospholipase family protein n=1 Tax=Anoxybacterium hadale TaxID=3408580 RepID=A0ACD1ADV7_9FIRM|nr:patatin-like phospholipase family protein [Clostridiales bacterium]
MENRKTALVLGGGGARGAYEVGVWQALRELGIRIDLVTGSSVGAINGALVAQDAFDLAVTLWRDIDTSMVFDMDLKDLISNNGIDNSKLKALLTKYIDETAVRSSTIDYGLITAELPSMTPKSLTKEQIPNGKLIDYILASSTLFPLMKSYEIDSLKYIDGGFTDNLPVGLAVDGGATHIIAVDLDAVGIIRRNKMTNADYLRVIQCPWDLGNILIFDKFNSKRILRLGYLDALKAFGAYDGHFFCFVKGEFDKRSLRGADTAGRIFGLNPEILYKKHIYNLHLKEAVDAHIQETDKELSTLSGSLKGKLLEGFVKAKSSLNQKTITLMIAKSLRETSDTKNIFLTKPAMKLLREEIPSANYLVKEGLI